MAGFESPNYTQIPNDLFETEMIKMGYAELKVVLAVCRQTFGYHRIEMRMSLTKLEKMTGLSRGSILLGALEAEKHGYIERINDGGVTLWIVKVVNQPKDDPVKKLNRTGKGSLPPSIKETIKETHVNKDIEEPTEKERIALKERIIKTMEEARKNGTIKPLKIIG